SYDVIPAKAGIHLSTNSMRQHGSRLSAFAEMTTGEVGAHRDRRGRPDRLGFSARGATQKRGRRGGAFVPPRRVSQGFLRLTTGKPPGGRLRSRWLVTPAEAEVATTDSWMRHGITSFRCCWYRPV